MHTPEDPEKQSEHDQSDIELPLWMKSLEQMRPELVKVVLQISSDYNLPLQAFIEDALREKVERYLLANPQIAELVDRILEQQKRQGPRKNR
jgi:hypothetical protein